MPNIRNEKRPISYDIICLFQPIFILYRKNIDILIQPYGISAGQPPLLSLLLEREGMSQKELVHLLGVKPSSVATMVARMENAKLIVRRKDENDSRVTRVYLTEKGRKSGRKMQAIISFINERLLAGFRDEEKILLYRFLEKMRGNLEKAHSELSRIKKMEGKSNSSI